MRAFTPSLQRWMSWLVASAENGSTEVPMKGPKSIKLTKPVAIAESKNKSTHRVRLVLENEGELLNDQPVAKGFTVEDE